MKLVFVIKTMTTAGGGAERVLAIVASGLAELGHDVTLVTLDKVGDGSFYPLHNEIRWIKLSLGDPSCKTSFWGAIHWIRLLRKELRRLQPDAVIAFMAPAMIAASASVIGTSIDLIGSEHTVSGYYADRRLELFLLQVAVRRARTVTVLSEAIREQYPDAIRRRMKVLRNPVVLEGRKMADPVGMSTQVKTMLSVGRLVELKDYSTAIQAFSRLARQNPDWRYRIIGDGILRNELQGLVDKNNMQDRIMLVGPKNKVEPEYEQAQILVIPSKFEGMPMVVIEAMAHGLPVIGFADCAGTNELVRHGMTGLLAQGEDRAAALSGTIEELVHSPERRRELGLAARRFAESFNSPIVVAEWNKLLENRRLVASGQPQSAQFGKL